MIKYSILVFIGACSYGIISTIIKLAYKQGYSVEEVIGSQYVTGFLLFLVFSLLFSRKKATWKQALFLMLTGTTTSFTGVFYGKSLETVPASIAIILLFQFTWIGILMEAVYLKKRPDSSKLFAVLLLLIGTFMAGNLFGKEAVSLTDPGIIWGLLSAVSFSLFIFASGKVAAELPSLNRSLFMSFGAAIFLTVLFTPDFMTNGSLQEGLWKFALPLGFFGVLTVLVLLFFIAFRAIHIANHSDSHFAMFVSFGIAAQLMVQTGINIAAMSGWFPGTGVTLPLVSYGGTSLIMTMGVLGVLSSISMRNRHREATRRAEIREKSEQNVHQSSLHVVR